MAMNRESGYAPTWGLLLMMMKVQGAVEMDSSSGASASRLTGGNHELVGSAGLRSAPSILQHGILVRQQTVILVIDRSRDHGT